MNLSSREVSKVHFSTNCSLSLEQSPFSIQELFTALDISKKGFIFLRDVVEILRYIKKDGICDQVEHVYYCLVNPERKGVLLLD